MRYLVVFLLGAAGLPAAAQTPIPRDLVLNEIMYDPPPAQGSGNEWVEVYNRSDQTYDLSAFRFADAADTTDITATPSFLEPGGYAVLVNDSMAFADAYPGVGFIEVPGFPPLNNGGDSLRLLFGDALIDEVPYAPSWGGADASLERIDPDGPSADATNWATSTDPGFATPGAQNSVFNSDDDPPALSDVFATEGTFLIVQYSEAVDSVSATDPANYTIPGGPDVIAGSVDPFNLGDPSMVGLVLDLFDPLQDSTAYTLNVSNIADLAGNVLLMASQEFLYVEGDAAGPGDIVINEVQYDPPPSQGSANEWVELYNRTEGLTFRLDHFGLADDSDTTYLPLGTTIVGPGEYVVLVSDSAAFAAAHPGVLFVEVPDFPPLNNNGDRPALFFGVDEIDAVPYAPSWGGRDASLERIDPAGPSGFVSNWATSLAPDGGTPGAQNSVFAPDTEPPLLASVVAPDPAIVVVHFSEPVTPETAGDPANYQIDNGIGAPAIADHAPEGDPAVVRLFLATPLQSPTTYTLTATGIADFAGNVLTQDTTTFFFGVGEAPEARDLVINEFLYDEPVTGSPGEYVELFNRSDKLLDLAGFTLGDSGGEAAVSEDPAFVQPGGYAVLVESGAAFAAVFPEVAFIEVTGWRALNNSGDAVVLRAGSLTVDSLFYDDAWGGEDAALERRDPEGPSSFDVNWRTTTAPEGGTPGAQNSVFAPDMEGPRPVAVAVSLDGRTLTVEFDEPMQENSIVAGAFSLTGPVTPDVERAAYGLSPEPTVTLTLAAPLALGDYTLTVSGVRDLLGNAAQGTTLVFSFAPDGTPPALDAAFARDSLAVEVRFSETVTSETARDPAHYQIDNGIGAPDSVVFPLDGDAQRALLLLNATLETRVLYTLTVSDIADPTGNRLATTTATLFIGEGDAPLPGEVVVNEIMYDPFGGSDGEYVEILNRTGKLFDLRDFALSDDGAPAASALAEVPTLLAPNAYLVLAANRDSFAVRFPEALAVVEAADFPSLNNAGDAVVLAYRGTVVDSVLYDPNWHRVELEDATGIALERVDPAGPSGEATNWSSSLDPSGGTPGRANSVFVEAGPPPEGIGLEVDSPFAPDTGQRAAIRYALETDAAIVRLRIFDGAGRLVRELEDGDLSGPSGTLLWDGRDDSGRRLRVGLYILLLEALDVEGGTSERHRAVVALARQF